MAKEKLLLIVFVCLGIILRLINLSQSFWLDEAAQAVLSQKTLEFIWYGRGGDFHPPLFYLLAHFWQLFSHSEIWLRLLPITFGIINIPIIYLLAKVLIPQYRKSGILAALFLAIAPYHIYYSQEYRSYSLLCLLGSVSLLCLLKKKYLQLALINSLLLYTHYASVFIIITQLIYVLSSSRPQFKSLLTSFFLSAILYLPWLPQLSHQLNSGLNIDTYLPGWRSVLSISVVKALPLIIFKIVAGRINLQPNYIYLIYICFVLGFTLLTLFLNKFQRRLFMIWTFIPIFSMLFISLFLPQNQPFRVIYILPVLLLLFVSCCVKHPKLIATIVIYISITGNFLYFTRARLQREQWRQATVFLSTQPAPILVKNSAPFAPLLWYPLTSSVIPVLSSFPAQTTEIESHLVSQLLTASHVYVLNYLTDLTDPQHLVEATLEKRGWHLSKTYNFEGVGFIYHYLRP